MLVIAFAVVVAYPYLPGSDSAAFKGVSLFLGVIFSLGSSSAIANVIAGYSLTYRRAFRLGDRVRIGDTIGDVMEMRMQVTHVRSVKNEEVVIPADESASIGLVDDGTWSLVVGMASELNMSDVKEAVVPVAGTVDRMIDNLTAAQRAELARLLQKEMGDLQ